jgi:hypothetical protein
MTDLPFLSGRASAKWSADGEIVDVTLRFTNREAFSFQGHGDELTQAVSAMAEAQSATLATKANRGRAEGAGPKVAHVVIAAHLDLTASPEGHLHLLVYGTGDEALALRLTPEQAKQTYQALGRALDSLKRN